jgi:hypothetical protein
MKAIRRRILPTIALGFLATATAAYAGTLSGTVINRTTGKPTPDIDLTLLSPTQGMREVGSAKSDAQGRFAVTNGAIGMAPILIRATFHDVSFNTFVPPGRPDVEVEIYDISKDPKTIHVASHIVIFEPHGDKLIGAEEYEITNDSQPPAAYFRTEGNFDFGIPEDGAIGQVTTTAGSMGMPVNQASIEKGKGHFAIAYAFRPGPTNVRLSYQLPYGTASATVKLPATYADVKMLVVAPPGVTIKGDGLTAAGQEQGMMVYTHDPLPAKGVLSVSVLGQGSPVAADGGAQDQGGQQAQEGNSRTGPEVIAAPSRLDDFKWPKWYIVVGLAVLFAMSGFLLTRKQVVVVEGSGADEAPTAKPDKPSKHKKSHAASVVGNGPSSSASVASLTAAVNNHVNTSMDALKDQILRLELRRQAGTISENEYVREKAQVDQQLRDLVKG